MAVINASCTDECSPGAGECSLRAAIAEHAKELGAAPRGQMAPEESLAAVRDHVLTLVDTGVRSGAHMALMMAAASDRDVHGITGFPDGWGPEDCTHLNFKDTIDAVEARVSSQGIIWNS